MAEHLKSLGLLLMKPEILFFFLLLGYLFIDGKIFKRTIILLLFAAVFNAFLKSLWNVPLNPALGLEGWAYPSGHTQFSVVMWLSLLLQLRKKWVSMAKWLILPLGLIYMVDEGYHDWPDVFGGICSAIIIVGVFGIWFAGDRKDEFLYSVTLTFSSCLMYLCLSLNSAQNYGWVTECLGLMFAITLTNNRTDERIARLSIAVRVLILGFIGFLIGSLVSLANPKGSEDLYSLLSGMLLGVSFFFALPTLLDVKSWSQKSLVKP
jgi:membrane-associated phospholipid phosphatase